MLRLLTLLEESAPKCLLNDSEVSALWDTGAQVSIMTQAMLEETLPGTAVKDILELINVGLDLTAANGTLAGQT